MIRSTHICDQCGTTHQNKDGAGSGRPPLWVSIGMHVDGGYNYGRTSGRFAKDLVICDACAKKLGIEKKPGVHVTKDETQSISDRLYDIFCEMVQESIK